MNESPDRLFRLERGVEGGTGSARATWRDDKFEYTERVRWAPGRYTRTYIREPLREGDRPT